MSSEAAVRFESRALPPLSLYHLLDPDVLADPYPLYHRLRTEDPVHWDPFLHAWVVTRYTDVVRVLHDFSADRTPTPEQLTAMGLSALNPIAQVMVKQMLFLDAPAHTRLRALACSAFTPSKVEVLRSHIREIADRLLDAVAGQSRIDMIADFAEPLPAIVTAEMLGVPVEHHNQLKAWSADFAEMLGNFQHNPGRAHRVLRSLEQMTAYFRDAIEQPRNGRSEGLIQSLATAEIQGDRLSNEEVIANSIITMVGGQETTTNLIGNGMLSLLRNREQLELLRADLSLIPSAVEELLRYESPSQHTARLAPRDCELGGRQIRKREAVIAVMAAGNRDPARFPNPDRLDITRKDNRHLAFGWAAHFCFGAALARIEGQIAFETILRRFHKLALEPGPLTWRTNLGLRGLTALPINFPRPDRGQRLIPKPIETSIPRKAPVPRLSETKQQLLAKYLQNEQKVNGWQQLITRRPQGESLALALSQEQILKRELAAAGMPAFNNESITIHRHGSLRTNILQLALTEIARRHEIWRTNYDTANGRLVQVIRQPFSVFPLKIIDLRMLPHSIRETEALRLATTEAKRPFNLERDPLIRATLTTLDDGEHRLFFTMHQSIVDGMCVYQILPLELISLYEAFAAGKPSPLPELAIQYADFAYWERERLGRGGLKIQSEYWRNRLAGNLMALQWPTDKLNPQSRMLSGAMQPFTFSQQLVSSLKNVSRHEGVTLFMVLLAGFAVLLSCYSHQEDIVVGTPAPAGRKKREVQELLGYFINPVALRIDLSGNPAFRDLLRRVRQTVVGALSHDDIPLEYVIDELKLTSDLKRLPLFQAAISLAPPLPNLPSGWDQTFMDVDSGGSRWDLYLELSERPSGILGRAQYDPDLFVAATVQRAIEDLKALLEWITVDPGERLGNIKTSRVFS
jgi:cytochrome P450